MVKLLDLRISRLLKVKKKWSGDCRARENQTIFLYQTNSSFHFQYFFVFLWFCEKSGRVVEAVLTWPWSHWGPPKNCVWCPLSTARPNFSEFCSRKTLKPLDRFIWRKRSSTIWNREMFVWVFFYGYLNAPAKSSCPTECFTKFSMKIRRSYFRNVNCGS